MTLWEGPRDASWRVEVVFTLDLPDRGREDLEAFLHLALAHRQRRDEANGVVPRTTREQHQAVVETIMDDLLGGRLVRLAVTRGEFSAHHQAQPAHVPDAAVLLLQVTQARHQLHPTRLGVLQQMLLANRLDRGYSGGASDGVASEGAAVAPGAPGIHQPLPGEHAPR